MIRSVIGLFVLGAVGWIPSAHAGGYPSDGVKHWAFEPVHRPIPPVSRGTNAVDAHVTNVLRAKGWALQEPASRRILLRRLYFDVLGLPTDLEQLDVFSTDIRPEAYERQVDRLLASPHFGERWGRHWLDVARYADNKGYVFEEERVYPYAYTYRDWVVNALNSDLPYDEFLRRQIAGDHVAGETGDTSAYAAMGFLTVGRRFLNRQPDIIDDRIDVVTRGTLGLTVSCSRCHDHKYDPIPTRDYYSLYGVFASSHEPSELPLLGEPDTESPLYRRYLAGLEEHRNEEREFLRKKHAAIRSADGLKQYLMLAWEGRDWTESQITGAAQQRKLYQRIAQRWQEYIRVNAIEGHAVFGPWVKAVTESGGIVCNENASGNPLIVKALAEADPKSVEEIASVYARVLSESDADTPHADVEMEELRQVLVGKGAPAAVTVDQIYPLLNTPDQQHVRRLRRRIQKYTATAEGAPPRGMVMLDREKPVEPVVFVRGNPASRGESVPRQFLSVLTKGDSTPFERGSGRIDLADAIVDPANPLTPRVAVNRIWMHYFGKPLVENPSDFGVRTPEPEHKPLLDSLASALLESQWSSKHVHRSILLSATYRQGSEDRPECRKSDPENRFIWRHNRRRLDWETLRDSMLASSGYLDGSIGGRPVDLEKQQDAGRRTLYGFIDRQNLPATFRTFDIASPDAHCDRRHETTVPQQALYMLNHPFVLLQAERLVNRPGFLEEKSVSDKVAWLYRQIAGREPDEKERNDAASFAISESDVGWIQLAQALLCSNEFAFVD